MHCIRPDSIQHIFRTLTQDLKAKQAAVEKPFHELSRRLDARERELSQMASESVKLAEAAEDLQSFVDAKKEELDKAPPVSAKIDKLRDQVGTEEEDVAFLSVSIEHALSVVVLYRSQRYE